MTKIGYAAILKQFHPTDLLDWAEQAEHAGFDAGFRVSEHFQPWTPQQGQSAFAWSFMGALGQRTSLRFGTAVGDDSIGELAGLHGVQRAGGGDEDRHRLLGTRVEPGRLEREVFAVVLDDLTGEELGDDTGSVWGCWMMASTYSSAVSIPASS